jgi:hypothetical protein
MIIALNLNRERIRPFPGGRALCQICNSQLIAHCGDIKVWHWQHKQDRDCDQWKEHETEWHRAWKNQFPIEWQETVMIGEDGEKHLADVKTSNGLVIEFQNSSISTSTIEIREEFYGNMIWVVNAIEFRDNIKMWSAVNSGLRRIDKGVIERIVEIEDELNKEIKDISDEIDKKESNRASKFNDLKFHKKDVEDLACHKDDINRLSERLIEHWNPAIHNFPNYFIQKLSSDINPQLKNDFLSIQSQLVDLKGELQQLQIKKDIIDAKANFEHERKTFKIIDYGELGMNNYHKAICIRTDTIDTLFKKVEKISSDLEFIRLKHKQSEYTIAVDPTDAYKSIEMQVESIKKDIETKELSQGETLVSIKQELSNLLSNKIEALKNKIELENDEDDELLFRISNLRIQLETKKMRKSQQLETSEKYLKDEVKADRFEIMRKKKGLYSYNWKYERTTWRFADMPIYFDRGDGFLFRKLSDSQFQKCSVEEFVKTYRKD